MTCFFVADPSVTGSQNGYGSQQQMLEEENESLAGQLRDKVKALKSVSEFLLPTANEVALRQCFQSRLSVYPGRGSYLTGPQHNSGTLYRAPTHKQDPDLHLFV